MMRIDRRLEPGPYRLTDVFADIRGFAVLAAIFADEQEIERAVAGTQVFVADEPCEMYVDNDDASIVIGLRHLREAPDAFLYLDIIHELCHVKQQWQGRDLYDRRRPYVDRDTEIEAYRITVREARRIGLDDEAIRDYLRVPWITDEEHRRLAAALGVRCGGDDR